MTEGKSEVHGCIVCGKLYQLVVAYDANGKFIASKVMGAGGKPVKSWLDMRSLQEREGAQV